MLKRFLNANIIAIIMLFAIVFSGSEALAQFGGKTPKNIVVMISDGWGRNHITAANYYQYGVDGAQKYEKFPVDMYMSTYLARYNNGADEDYDAEYNPYKAWTDFDYVKHNPTGSAAAATAMSTGQKTYYRSIGIATDGTTPLKNIAQQAKEIGKAAGVVSSVQFAHATPAAYVAHQADRGSYSDIANEMINSDIDLIMGCGNPEYNNDGQPASNSHKYVGGEDTWNSLKNGETDWTLIQSRDEFQALMTGETPAKVIGVPQVYSTLQQSRSGDGHAAPYEVPLTTTIPTLEEMTKAALNVLDADEDGFFLMVEGGAVDWASHANQSGRVIEEQIDFNDAVDAVISWIEANGGWEETMLVVTGDHECGYLTGPGSGPSEDGPVWNEIVNNGQGVQPGMEWHSGNHTNQIIPFYANGAGSDIFNGYADEIDPKRGEYITNSELGQACFKLWTKPEEKPRVPKNVFILISDGWGRAHIDATNYYEQGATGVQVYESFPINAYMSTYLARYNNGSISEYNVGYNPYKAWSEFDYVKSGATGSAAAATAMSTGFKTYYRSIGMDVDGERLYNLTQKAKNIGKAAGVVTSVQFAHATPAAYVAHKADRGSYSDIANEMLWESDVDVIMGCGNPEWDDSGNPASNSHKYVGGEESWMKLRAGENGWTLVEKREDFQNLATGVAPPRIVGVPEAYSTLQQSRSGAGDANPYAIPMNENVPTLDEMTKAALNALDNNQNGLFLMVEGGAVDWASHANQSGRMIEEQSDFNRMVESVCQWVEQNGGWEESLVIVTGDHECGYLTGPGSDPIYNPVVNNGAGNLPGMEWHSGGHTNQIIPFFAKGAGSEIYLSFIDHYDGIRGGYLNNSELAAGVFQLWNEIPELRAPENKCEKVSVNPTLTWKPVPNGNKYHIQISKDPTFASVSVDENDVCATSFKAVGLENNATYHWRVKSGDAPWSGYFSFTTAPAATKDLDKPKNIIVLISDGWGINHIEAADYYQYGMTGMQIYESFPVQYYMSTYLARYNNGQDEDYNVGYNPYEAWKDFDYVKSGATGSAAAATAMATGYKTYYRSIGMDVDGNPLENMTQRAKSLGKAAGVVTSVQFAHATPAAYVAHNSDRGDYSGIALEMINSDIDVVMGCGNPNFDNDGLPANNSYSFVGDEATWNALKAGTSTRTLIESLEDFQALASGATPSKILGVPQVYSTLQQSRGGDGHSGAYCVPFSENIPTLEEMTKGALNVLDADEDGFFLMIEGGAVDWASHANQSGRVIEEQIDFNKTVDAVCQWVEQNGGWGENLVIVTGDHECGYLTGPNSGNTPDGSVWNPVKNNGKGNMPGMEWHSGNHTNQIIPFYAKGAGSELFDTYTDEFDPKYGPYITNSELGQACMTLFPKPEEEPKTPKNVVIMISDGWGRDHIDATNYYEEGATDVQVYEQFPVNLYMSTYLARYNNGRAEDYNVGYNPYKAWSDFDYVKSGATGSAAAATAMATGYKTYYRSIGMDVNVKPMFNLTQYAQKLGKAAGVVTSVQFAHATPAAYVAHNVDRGDYSGIANEMILRSGVDVIMGCGNPDFDDNGSPSSKSSKYVGGDETWNMLKSGKTDWTLVQSREEFQNLANGETPKRVIGVPEVNSTLQQSRSGDGKADPFVVPMNENVANLEEMTKAALNVLDNNPNGIFLMVEGGAVDWASHGNQSGRVIEEQYDFNRSVEAVCNWVETNSSWDETLVIVTGDHECGYLTGPNSDPVHNPVVNNGKGALPGMEWHSGNHTNQIIPFFAKGAGSELYNKYADHYDPKRGAYINNSELASAIFNLWREYPVPTCPVNGDDKVSVNGAFTWNTVTKAIDYHLMVATDENFNNIIIDANNVIDPIYKYSALNPKSKYYWKVKANYKEGCSEWCGTHCFTTEDLAKKDPKLPKNIVVLISDGWGLNHIEAANYYQYGYKNAQKYESFPVQYYMSTYLARYNSGQESDYNVGYNPYKAWTEFDYVKSGATGSAAAATAMATGEKSYYRAIGVGVDRRPLETIAQRAKYLGKAAGVVTSVQFAHATPAAYVAHNIDRGDYSGIAQEMIDSDMDVIMGCGNPEYDNDGQPATNYSYSYVGGEDYWNNLKTGRTTWTLLQDRSEFQNLASGETPRRVIGVPKVASTLQQSRSGAGYSGGGQEDAYAVPFSQNVPTLEEMTKGALNVLDNNDKGFFLMVEGGAVDWASHGNQSGRVIEEQIDFNKTVDAVIEWVENNGGWDETLVVVTGDHECGYLTGPNSDPDFKPIVNNGKGNMPGMEWHSGNHTNQIIPLYANGAGGELFGKYADEFDPMRGAYITNSELGQICMRLFPKKEEEPKTPKNVFVMISDGWGRAHIDAANYYEYGTNYAQVYEQFPINMYMSTYLARYNNGSISDYNVGYNPYEAWSEFDYVKSGATGSAAAATAMATGYKTYYRSIGMDVNEKPLQTLCQQAKLIGKSAGVVTSVQFAHATPAAYVAHNLDRGDYSGIANEMLNSDVDVIMGCGNPEWSNDGEPTTNSYNYVGGYETWSALKSGLTDWTLVQSKQDFCELISGETPDKVLGVPTVYSTLQQSRSGNGSADAYAVPFTENVPTLEEMTKAAVNVLDNNDNGFFLMVEGGAVDWASHGNQSGRVIEEQIDFNDAVNSVVDWILLNGGWDENLLIVTGDHECGYLTGPNSDPEFNPVQNNGKGAMPGMEWHSGNHTNQIIPFFAKGAGSELYNKYADHFDPEKGAYINNSELAQVVYDVWGRLPAQLVAPDNCEEDVAVDVCLTWGEEETADRYQVQIADNEALSNKTTYTTTEPKFRANLDYLQTYYWRVRSVNDAGCGLWSEVRSFVTENGGALEVTLTDKEVCVGSDVELGSKMNCDDNEIITTVKGGSGNYRYYWSPSYGLLDRYSANPTAVNVSRSRRYNLRVYDLETRQSAYGYATVYTKEIDVYLPSYVFASRGEEVELGERLRVRSGSAPYAYYWTDRGGWASTEENPVVTLDRSKRFYLTVYDADGCQSREKSVYVRVSWRKDAEAVAGLPMFDMSLFPNPTSDYLTIEADFSSETPVEIKINNMLGETVANVVSNANGFYQETIDMSSLPAGSYMIQINAGGETFIEKIIKQ